MANFVHPQIPVMIEVSTDRDLLSLLKGKGPARAYVTRLAADVSSINVTDAFLVCCDDCRLVLNGDRNTVVAVADSKVTLHGSGKLFCRDQAIGVARNFVNAIGTNSSHVMGFDNSHVSLFDRSSGLVTNRTRLLAYDYSMWEANEYTDVVGYGQSSGRLKGAATAYIHEHARCLYSGSAVVAGTGYISKLVPNRDPLAFIKGYGLGKAEDKYIYAYTYYDPRTVKGKRVVLAPHPAQLRIGSDTKAVHNMVFCLIRVDTASCYMEDGCLCGFMTEPISYCDVFGSIIATPKPEEAVTSEVGIVKNGTLHLA